MATDMCVYIYIYIYIHTHTLYACRGPCAKQCLHACCCCYHRVLTRIIHDSQSTLPGPPAGPEADPANRKSISLYLVDA